MMSSSPTSKGFFWKTPRNLLNNYGERQMIFQEGQGHMLQDVFSEKKMDGWAFSGKKYTSENGVHHKDLVYMGKSTLKNDR